MFLDNAIQLLVPEGLIRMPKPARLASYRSYRVVAGLRLLM